MTNVDADEQEEQTRCSLIIMICIPWPGGDPVSAYLPASEARLRPCVP